jgi:hypothetical protein
MPLFCLFCFMRDLPEMTPHRCDRRSTSSIAAARSSGEMLSLIAQYAVAESSGVDHRRWPRTEIRRQHGRDCHKAEHGSV